MNSPCRRLILTLSLLLSPLAARPAAAESVALPGKPFSVSVAKVTAKKGQAATAKVVFKPGAGFHLNKDFPTVLKLQPAVGVTLSKNDFSQKDAALSENEGSFSVTFTASEPGKKLITGDLRFAVCTESTCNPQRSPITIEVEVQ